MFGGLSPQSINNRVQALARHAGIDARITAHSARIDPRAKSGIALGVVSLGIGLLVGFLAKGKKHWFTIEFEGVADHPENYHYLRLDKGNYRRILQAVEAATGLDVEVLEEE